MRRVPAVAVVGYKNTGKTTLVSRLVAAFTAEGLRVGTCKHDGQDHILIDDAGTDTGQHRQAGAAVTLVASPSHAVMQTHYQTEPDLAHWLELLYDPSLQLDLILVEGWKQCDLPKLVLLGQEKIETLTNVIGYVQKTPASPIAEREANVYDRDDIVRLVQLIKLHVLQG